MRTFTFVVDSGASPPPTGLITTSERLRPQRHSPRNSGDQFGRSSPINDASIWNTSLTYSDSARRVVTMTSVYSGDHSKAERRVV